jgi:hypothetical protein
VPKIGPKRLFTRFLSVFPPHRARQGTKYTILNYFAQIVLSSVPKWLYPPPFRLGFPRVPYYLTPPPHTHTHTTVANHRLPHPLLRTMKCALTALNTSAEVLFRHLALLTGAASSSSSAMRVSSSASYVGHLWQDVNGGDVEKGARAEEHRNPRRAGVRFTNC